MNEKNRYRPALYFGLAFFITWTNGFILVAQSRQGEEKSIIVLLLAYMGPYIAALIMQFIFKDKKYRADFRRRIYNIKLVSPGYLALTILILPLSMIFSIFISIVFGQPADQLMLADELRIFDGEVVLSMIVLGLVPFLEELGWRGYGVDSLISKFNLFKTSLIFALLWGVWHLPVFFIANSYQSSLWGQHPLFAINFFVGIIPLAIIMNFLYYKNSRSIFLIALFHILVNYSSELFEANQISKCILTLVLSVAAAIIVITNKGFFFQDKIDAG